MGWRDICRSTDERTVIATAFPRSGVNHKLPLVLVGWLPRETAALLANWSSLVFDYVARQKLGGTSLTYFCLKQLPVIPPSEYGESDLVFIVPRVLELIYTSHSMTSFAHDLGYDGPPFAWDEDRRAQLRAELDAWYARAYGLTLDELRYILDPADVKGEDYPSETFRGLKTNEIRRYGEFRTRRLVLEAWDRMQSEGRIDAYPVIAPAAAHALPQRAFMDPGSLPDDAWVMPNDGVHSIQAQLAAILKALPGPAPMAKVRLATLYALKPRYLTPHLAGEQLRLWNRLVGTGAAAPSGTNALNFVPKMSATWRDAYTQLRGMKALIEDLSTGTWASGSSVKDFFTEGWPDGRAVFVLKAMEAMNISRVVSELPPAAQAWVMHGHAA